MSERATTDGKPADPTCEGTGAPQPVDPATGQHKAYWVLTEDERRKGFVRPVRRSYVHVGPAGPTHPLRDLTTQEDALYASEGYVKFEPYTESGRSTLGQYWTQAQLDAVNNGCGALTQMGIAIAETYARAPNFYGSTFCAGCRRHLPIAEFVWDGTQDRVGS